MRLIAVRHGQTACNTDNIWHGWDDCELTLAGQSQAAAVGERLAGEPIAAVYSSDSRRAVQTAEAIAARHHLQPLLEPGLRERYSGTFECRPVAQVEAEHPTIWEDRAADYWGWRPPGGETFRQVLDRALPVIERLQAQHPQETVVVVTHMCPLRVLISRLAGIPIEETYRSEFPSTGVTIFRLEGDGAQVETLNDAAHAG